MGRSLGPISHEATLTKRVLCHCYSEQPYFTATEVVTSMMNHGGDAERNAH